MTDIVDRLREHGDCEIKDAGKWIDFASLYLADAAAEIERLRARLEIDPSHPYDGIYARDETIRQQDKQIERLRAALHDVLGWHDYSNDMHKPIEVRAAYMRARAALEGK